MFLFFVLSLDYNNLTEVDYRAESLLLGTWFFEYFISLFTSEEYS